MILADTNVVSELMRDSPDRAVLDWARGLSPTGLTICVVTIEEIERGLARLPDGRRRQNLTQRWRRLVERFGDLIAVYDVRAAQETAKVLVSVEAAGRPMSLSDAEIAGVCLANGFELATRNERDFEAVRGLVVVNPFMKHPAG